MRKVVLSLVIFCCVIIAWSSMKFWGESKGMPKEISKTPKNVWWFLNNICTSRNVAPFGNDEAKPANPLFQNISKFVVFIDYGENFEQEVKALDLIKKHGINECNKAFESDEFYCSNVEKKYIYPFYPSSQLEQIIHKSIKLAYAECIQNFDIKFVNANDDSLDVDKDTLVANVFFPKIKNDDNYNPAFNFKLDREGMPLNKTIYLMNERQIKYNHFFTISRNLPIEHSFANLFQPNTFFYKDK